MNKKKRSIIIIFILLILIISLSIISFFLNLNQENNLVIGINDYMIFKDKIVDFTLNDLYFIRNNYGKTEIVDSEGTKYFEITGTVEEATKVGEGFIIYTTDQSLILSSSYEVVYRTPNHIEQIEDDITNTIFYYEIGNNKQILYDKYLNEVLNFNNQESISIISIVANKIYTSNGLIYDIGRKELIDTYDEIINISSKYYLIKNKDSIILVDKKNNRMVKVDSYYKKNNRYILSSNNETIIIGENGTIYNEVNMMKLNNNYYLDAIACDYGWILKDSKDNVIYDKCSLEYDIRYIEDGVLIVKNLNQKYNLIVDNTSTKDYDYMKIEDKYIYAEDENGTRTIFDLNGFSILSEYKDILGFKSIGNNQYITYVEGEKIKLLDENLKIIETYDEFNCSDNVCITSKDNKYGLYYNGKQQIDNRYMSIKKNISNYVISDISYDAILKISKVKKDKKLDSLDKMSDEYYKEINIEEIIEKYNLYQLREEINKNQEFFQKYSYVVEHNEKISSYKDKIFNFYKVIIDNERFIEEDRILYGLKYLSMENKDNIDILDAAGVYTDYDKKIEIKRDKMIPSVYYHELFHFLDYNSGYEKINNRYICNNTVYSLEDYKHLDSNIRGNCSRYNVPSTNFITEAGAEVYTSEYFIDTGETTAYKFGTYIYEILNYIFSNGTMKSIYYSSNTDDEFYKMLVEDLKMPIRDYESMIDTFYKLTTISTMNDKEVLTEAKDWLVYLYKLKNYNKDYSKDIEFLYYLKYSQGIDKYTEPYKNVLHNINEQILIDIYGYRRGYNIREFSKKEEGTYIYFNVLGNNYSIIDNIRVLYDFNSNKIIDYKRIEGA